MSDRLRKPQMLSINFAAKPGLKPLPDACRRSWSQADCLGRARYRDISDVRQIRRALFAPRLSLHHLTGNLLDIPYARVSRLGLLAPSRALGGLFGGRLSLCDLRRGRLRVARSRG